MGKLALILAAVVACGGSDTSADEPGREKIELGDRSKLGQGERDDPDETDEGDDDGIQIEGTRGKLESYDIERGMEPHKTARTGAPKMASSRSISPTFLLSKLITGHFIILYSSFPESWAPES